MAEENEELVDEGKSGGKKIIIFVVIGLLLMGVTVGVTLLVVTILSPEPKPAVLAGDTTQTSTSGETVEEEIIEIKPAIYFPIKPVIIVNFQSHGRQRFMQADVSLMTRDDDVVEAIEVYMPLLRNRLILIFGAQEYDELQTEEGREILRQDALIELQNIIEEKIGKPGIKKLLFTNLVMQ